MRELVHDVALGLDGDIAAPDGGLDAFPVEGDHAAVVFGEFIAGAVVSPGHRAAR